uniref:Uncharacterized protein n=1 Tax=Arundo donax TaxID=35708 RepID=A0A0A8YGE1_ARUDO
MLYYYGCAWLRLAEREIRGICVWILGELALGPKLARIWLASVSERIQLAHSSKAKLAWVGEARQARSVTKQTVCSRD